LNRDELWVDLLEPVAVVVVVRLFRGDPGPSSDLSAAGLLVFGVDFEEEEEEEDFFNGDGDLDDRLSSSLVTGFFDFLSALENSLIENRIEAGR
jgi:hypothetical protein